MTIRNTRTCLVLGCLMDFGEALALTVVMVTAQCFKIAVVCHNWSSLIMSILKIAHSLLSWLSKKAHLCLFFVILVLLKSIVIFMSLVSRIHLIFQFIHTIFVIGPHYLDPMITNSFDLRSQDWLAGVTKYLARYSNQSFMKCFPCIQSTVLRLLIATRSQRTRYVLGGTFQPANVNFVFPLIVINILLLRSINDTLILWTFFREICRSQLGPLNVPWRNASVFGWRL